MKNIKKLLGALYHRAESFFLPKKHTAVGTISAIDSKCYESKHFVRVWSDEIGHIWVNVGREFCLSVSRGQKVNIEYFLEKRSRKMHYKLLPV